MYRVAAYSNVGAIKSSNQDSCCVGVAQTPFGDTMLLSVCDGVGGFSAGEVASASVIRWLSDWFDQRYPFLLLKYGQDRELLFDFVQRDWASGLALLNETLGTYGRNTNQRLGSTFTAILFFRGGYLIGHVGDCRVYQLYNKKLVQLTEDQTWVAREVKRGTISPEQARNHPRSNVILQSVGTQKEIQPVFERGTEAPLGSTYFVCCDGFRNELFDDEMLIAFESSRLSSEAVMHEAAEGLARMAMQRGERDNITVVLACAVKGDDYDQDFISVPEGVATVLDLSDDTSTTECLENTSDVTTSYEYAEASQTYSADDDGAPQGTDSGSAMQKDGVGE